MVLHHRGRGLTLLGTGLSCASGFGLAVLDVLEANHGVLGGAAPQRDLWRSAMGMSGGILLVMGLRAGSSLTEGWLQGAFFLAAGGSVIVSLAASWHHWRWRRA